MCNKSVIFELDSIYVGQASSLAGIQIETNRSNRDDKLEAHPARPDIIPLTAIARCAAVREVA